MRGQPERELGIVKDLLAGGGRLYLFNQPLQAHRARELAESEAGVLDTHGFSVDALIVEELTETTASCVIAHA